MKNINWKKHFDHNSFENSLSDQNLISLPHGGGLVALVHGTTVSAGQRFPLTLGRPTGQAVRTRLLELKPLCVYVCLLDCIVSWPHMTAR